MGVATDMEICWPGFTAEIKGWTHIWQYFAALGEYLQLRKAVQILCTIPLSLVPYLPLFWHISKAFSPLSLVIFLKTAAMERVSNDHRALINQFEAMAVRTNSRRTVQLGENEVNDKDWRCCLAVKVITSIPVVFSHLKEALHKC
jgi:hypothetical protein